MTSAEVYGRIGAAKAFSSNVQNALGEQNEENARKLVELENELKQEKNPDEQKKLRKKIRRLKRTNVMNGMAEDASNSATNFLTALASYLDFSMEAIAQFIAKTLVSVLPALEVSVKMLLLTNIKKMVSCAIDPRIPDEWRTQGILINEATIDPRMILQASPFTKWGKYLYFGVYRDGNSEYLDNIDDLPHVNMYELSRAQDMNAFLWFARTKASFVSPNIIDDVSAYFEEPTGSTVTLYNTTEFKGKSGYEFVEGCTFKMNSNAATTFLCTKKEDSTTDNKYWYRIIPATDRWTGITWYKDTTSIYQKYKTVNYKNSKPLFNIEYLPGPHPEYLYPDGNFRFRIMPKPFSTAGGFIVDLQNNLNEMQNFIGSNAINEVIGDEIVNNDDNFQFTGIQSPIPYTARFDSNGYYDKKGRYSIDSTRYYVEKSIIQTGDSLMFDIKSIDSNNTVAKLKFDKKTKIFYIVNGNNPSQTLPMVDEMPLLSECYGGKTVYEFNYDYVMSMRLFDAQSVAIGIVDSLMGVATVPNIPPIPKIPDIPNIHFVNYGDNKNKSGSRRNIDQIRIDSFVDKLVEKMIDTEEYEFTDCFYTFSNEDYESMEMDVAQKIANNSLVIGDSDNAVQQVYDIINAYDADASLNERTEILTKAIMKAAETCGYDNNTQNSINSGHNIRNYQQPLTQSNSSNGDFITRTIKFLTSSIVNSLLTPKVLLLLQVNRMMMGTYALPTRPGDLQNNYQFNVQDVLNGLSGLLKGVIREVVDRIHQELLRMILERLNEILASFLKRLGIEYAMKWVNIIKQIFSCVSIPRRNRGSNGLNDYMEQYVGSIDSILANVDYADIDYSIDEIIPNTNPC